MLQLDHIAVLGETLEEAVTHSELALGQPLQPGGRHEAFGTHNRVLGLDPEIYLEAISRDPGAPPPGRARWFGLDHFAGPARLDKWICRVDDLDAALEVLPMAGCAIDLERGSLRWRMAVPEDGMLPFDGLFPALIEWQCEVPPGKALPPSGCSLRELTVSHPEGAALAELLGPHLEIPNLSIVEGDRPMLRAEFDTAEGAAILQ
ncbi:VOC family protein [Allosediminivita pacifica]|uniref:Glyoxalase-like protein n=1 Tax=Allosediminivita pacifica TaxID=1267769 RepID=A0A2T6AJ47_9RHOB|nr:VOC family protein [Allosediminivita pacifica]PTX43855.1 glyoxalase-like protein [Allosediminivita pacifica]GGB22315.1 polyphosphate kinase [Allosediminivita pacifica]